MPDLPQKFTGKTLEKALSEAANALNVDQNVLNYQVLQKEKKGLISKKDCVIEVLDISNNHNNADDPNSKEQNKEQSKEQNAEDIEVSVDGYFNIDVHEDVSEYSMENSGETEEYEDRALNNQGDIFRPQVYLTVHPPEGRGKYVKWADVKHKLEQKGLVIQNENSIVEIVRKSEGTQQDISQYLIEYIIAGSFDIRVEDNKMKAMLKVDLPQGRGEAVTLEQVTEELTQRKIDYNVDYSIINRCISEGTEGEYLTIAQGDQPVDGNDAEVIPQFEQKERKPVLRSDGSVDYYNIDNITNVSTGDTLAVKHPPEEGVPGKDVYGNIAPPKSGKDLQIKGGKNTEFSDDGLTLTAAADGQVVMTKDGFIHVYPVYEVSGDVDVSTGNINFIGNVVVKGQIQSGMQVKAAGDVEVKQTVDSCVIEAGGNVDIRGGIQGRHKGQIYVGGDLTCKFIENASVYAEGDVSVVEGILHSDVQGDKIYVYEGKKGLLVGGNVTAKEEVVTKVIGSNFATSTCLIVGLDPKLRKKQSEINNELQTTEENLEKTSKAVAMLQKLKQTHGKLPEDKESMFNRLQRTKSNLEQRKEELSQEKEKLQNTLQEKQSGKVIAQKIVYPGVRITIGNANYNIRDEERSVMFRLASDGEISSEPAN